MINMTNEVTVLQDELMTETERLAFAATWLRDEMKQVGIETDNMITTNLYIGITNVELDEELLRRQIHRTQKETQRLKERVRGKRNLEKTMTKCEKASYKTEDAAELFFARLFSRKLQNIFGECCISNLEKVAEAVPKPSGSGTGHCIHSPLFSYNV